MIANASEHQAMILGRTNHQFSSPVKNSIDLFGMTVDNELSFDDHISAICKKINNQFNMMIRFRKLISISTMMRLCRVFILPHFHYCSSVWHFCTSQNSDKLAVGTKQAYPEIYSTRQRITILPTVGESGSNFTV